MLTTVAVVFYVGLGFTFATETANGDADRGRKPPSIWVFMLTILFWPFVALYRAVKALVGLFRR